MRKTIEERFWEKVDIRSKDECWEWQAFVLDSHNLAGYGRFKFTSGNVEYAHRVSWKLTYGEISSGLKVLHKCDNPPCVNPNHLFLGTLKDNSQDMVSKGRWKRYVSYNGELNPSAKLTDRKVKTIKELIRKNMSPKNIANKFGVNRETIYSIKNGLSWKHIP